MDRFLRFISIFILHACIPAWAQAQTGYYSGPPGGFFTPNWTGNPIGNQYLPGVTSGPVYDLVVDGRADPTGSVSILASWTNALSALSLGGTIKLPCGTFSVPSRLIVNQSSILLRGQGQCTVLKYTGVSSSAITPVLDVQSGATYFRIEHVSINHSANTGSYIAPIIYNGNEAAGSAVLIQGDYFSSEDLYISYGWNNCLSIGAINPSTGVSVTSSPKYYSVHNTHTQYCGVGPSGGGGGGIDVLSGAFGNVTDAVDYESYIGFILDYGAGAQGNFQNLLSLYPVKGSASGTGECLYIGSSDSNFAGIQCIGAGFQGVFVDSFDNDLRFSNILISGSKYDGLVLKGNGNGNISFSNVTILNAGQQTANTYSGLVLNTALGGSLTNVSFENLNILGTSQKYGVATSLTGALAIQVGNADVTGATAAYDSGITATNFARVPYLGAASSFSTLALTGNAAAGYIGKYYNGYGLFGSSASGGNPVFGVGNSSQTGEGLGATAFTVLDTNAIYTFNNTLDDGSGNAIVLGLKIGSNAVSLAGSLTTSGAYGLTLTATNTTNATLPAGTKTLADLSDNQTFSGTITHSAPVSISAGTYGRISGASGTAAAFPASGEGIELTWQGSAGNYGIIQAYDRGSSAWRQLNMDAAVLQFNGGSNGNVTFPGSGTFSVAGVPYLSGAPSGSLASYYACYDPSSSPGGEITYQATNCTTSLRAMKHDIAPYKTGLQDALALNPSSFVMNSGTNGRRQIGLIAEDVRAVNDNLAGYQDDMLRTVQYDRIGVVAIAAIQEQQKLIAEMRVCQSSWLCRLFGWH